MIKTNIELLNEISAKLGGKSDASVLVEGLNNIANALGDTDPDQMVTVPQALETVLDHMDGGGGDVVFKKVKITNSRTSGTASQSRVRVQQPIVDDNVVKEQTITILSGQSADVNVIPATTYNFMYLITNTSGNDVTVTGTGAEKVGNLVNSTTRYTVVALKNDVTEFTVGE